MPNRIKIESDDLQLIIDNILDNAYERHDIEIYDIDELQDYLANYKNDFVFTDIGNMLNVNYFSE